MARQEVELLVRVEPALALVDRLHRAVPPRPEQRADPRRPRPLPHPVEQLALADVVAVHELLVGEQVAMRVQDPLRQPGRARRVVQLGRDRRRQCRRTRTPSIRCASSSSSRISRCSTSERSIRSAFAASVTSTLRLGVGQPVADPLVAVQDRHRQQDRADLPGSEERRGRLGGRRQQHRDAVAALDAVRGKHVREPVRVVLELTPAHAPDRCRESPRGSSRAGRAGDDRRRRRRCCSAREPPSDAPPRPPRRSEVRSSRTSRRMISA